VNFTLSLFLIHAHYEQSRRCTSVFTERRRFNPTLAKNRMLFALTAPSGVMISLNINVLNDKSMLFRGCDHHVLAQLSSLLIRDRKQIGGVVRNYL
jgi:hypothetical protein